MTYINSTQIYKLNISTSQLDYIRVSKKAIIYNINDYIYIYLSYKWHRVTWKAVDMSNDNWDYLLQIGWPIQAEFHCSCLVSRHLLPSALLILAQSFLSLYKRDMGRWLFGSKSQKSQNFQAQIKNSDWVYETLKQGSTVAKRALCMEIYK